MNIDKIRKSVSAKMLRSTKTPSFVILICFVIVFCYALFSFSFITKPPKDPSPEQIFMLRDSETQKNVLATNYNYQGLAEDDPALIAYIRSLLQPPSAERYHLAEPKRKHFTFMEQSKYVGDLYGPGKREGFFVEVGALDGEKSSSTLYLERELGFKGLLIEPNPINYRELLGKKRKAFTINAALSPTTTAEELLFSGSGAQGHLAAKKTGNVIRVKAFPFYSILQALNVSFVDVFNLDIEGFEFKVLKTIPWDKLKFGIFIVEHLNIPEPHQDVVKYMAKLGYDKIHENYYDYIFADPDYLKKLKKSS